MADQEAARAYAAENAREVACESIAKGRLDLDHFIQVTLGDGTALQVRFGDVISVVGGS